MRRAYPSSNDSARQTTWLPGANRAAAITRCHELLDGEDWRARWWRELPQLERHYLLLKIDAPREWASRDWPALEAETQDGIVAAARTTAQLFQCGRRRRGLDLR